MRHALAALVLVLALPCLPTPAGADVEGDFAGILAELEDRRDNDFSGTLDRAGRRRLAAVEDAIDVIEGRGSDIKSECTAAYKSAKSVQKAYPAEMAIAPALEGDFGDLYGDLFDSLEERIRDDLDRIEAALSGLSAGLAAKLQKGLDKAQAILDSLSETDRIARAKGLVAAAKQALQAGSRVPPADHIVVPHNGVTYYVDPDLTITGGILHLEATAFGGNGFILNFTTTTAVTGPGEYAYTAGSTYYSGYGTYSPDEIAPGAITVTSFDGERLVGSFTFTGDRQPDEVPGPATFTVAGTIDARIDVE